MLENTRLLTINRKTRFAYRLRQEFQARQSQLSSGALRALRCMYLREDNASLRKGAMIRAVRTRLQLDLLTQVRSFSNAMLRDGKGGPTQKQCHLAASYMCAIVYRVLMTAMLVSGDLIRTE